MTDGDFVILNLSGSIFKLRKMTFQRLPTSCFEHFIDSSVRKDGTSITEEFYLERHAESFSAILWYYTNGELHMPTTVCPAIFKRELEFWAVEPSRMSRCCYMKYVSFFEDQALLKLFEQDETKSAGNEKRRKIGISRWERFRRKIWTLLDDPSSSPAARIYIAVSAIFILISIFVLCASTHPLFQRELDLQEWEEYYRSEPEILQQLKDGRLTIRTSKNGKKEKYIIKGKDGNENFKIAITSPIPFQKSKGKKKGKLAKKKVKLNRKDSSAKITEILNNSEIVETYLKDWKDWNISTQHLPSNTVTRYRFLDLIDYCMVTYFAFELIIRFIFCPLKSKFFVSLLNIIDLVALSSECCIMLFEYLFPKEKFTTFSPLDIVECIQIARVFRLFRLVKNFIGFRILVYSVRASMKNMLLMIFNLIVAALIFSSVVFYCDRSSFQSIPDAIWWSVVTMTTVGYGDLHPGNVPGKILGCLCAISGVFVVAVSIPVLVNNFLLFTGFARIPIKRKSDDLASLLQCEFDSVREKKTASKEKQKFKVYQSSP